MDVGLNKEAEADGLVDVPKPCAENILEGVAKLLVSGAAGVEKLLVRVVEGVENIVAGVEKGVSEEVIGAPVEGLLKGDLNILKNRN